MICVSQFCTEFVLTRTLSGTTITHMDSGAHTFHFQDLDVPSDEPEIIQWLDGGPLDQDVLALVDLADQCKTGNARARRRAEAKLRSRYDELMIVAGLDPTLARAQYRQEWDDRQDLARTYGHRGLVDTLRVCIAARAIVIKVIAPALAALRVRVSARKQKLETIRAAARDSLLFVAFPPRRAAQGRDFAANSAA